MKKFILSFIFIGYALAIFSQQTINGSIMHDNIERDYILYVPEIYSDDTPVPLVFNFHGYTSNAEQQMAYGDFRSIADTANFIVVQPQGTLLNGITHWNVGGFTLGSTTDDVGFTAALLDSISAEYNINSERVYSTGMSNGGFMSFLLACQLSEKIAAIASVTGSMSPENFDDCNPQHPTPVMQIHGTSDMVIAYNGAAWTKPIEEVIDYWVDYNGCSDSPLSIEIPDNDTNDGSTAEHFIYQDGMNQSTVEHIKITGGGHTWPGTAFGGFGTNNDFSASLEIWKFFSRYDINGLVETPTNTEDFVEKNISVSIFPNPTSSHIYIENNFSTKVEYKIISSLGENLLSGEIISDKQTIDLTELSPNIYFLKIGSYIHRFIKTK